MMLHSPSQKINLAVFEVEAFGEAFGEAPKRYRVSAKFDGGRHATIPSIQYLRTIKDWKFTIVPDKLVGKTIEFEHVMLRGSVPATNTGRYGTVQFNWSYRNERDSPNDVTRFFLLVFRDVEEVSIDNRCTIVSKSEPAKVQKGYLRNFSNLITEDDDV